MDKYKSKQALFRISSDEEKKDFQLLELAELNDNYEKVMKVLAELSETLSGSAKTKEVAAMILALTEGIKQIKSNYSTQAKQSIEAFKEMQDEFVKGLRGLGEILEKHSQNSSKPHKAFDDFSLQLVELNKHSKRTSELITNLKWNTYMGVKDQNGSPVNPSIAGFNITTPYDYISLGYTGNNITTVVYKSGGASGNTVATLTLAYSGSNITSVTRT